MVLLKVSKLGSLLTCILSFFFCVGWIGTLSWHESIISDSLFEIHFNFPFSLFLVLSFSVDLTCLLFLRLNVLHSFISCLITQKLDHFTNSFCGVSSNICYSFHASVN